MGDVKATTLKENKKTKLKGNYNFNVYGDEHKQELNPNRHTNPVAMPFQGLVMLNLLQSQC